MPTISEWAHASSRARAQILEGYLLLHIRPKPAWMPERLYKWLITRLLYLELFDGGQR